MKTVGIIGGIAPESTIEYYRKIVSAYLEREATRNYPQIIINSIDMTKMLDLIGNGEFEEVSRYLADEVKNLSLLVLNSGFSLQTRPILSLIKFGSYRNYH